MTRAVTSVQKLPGVTAARLEQGNSRLVVSYDPQLTSLDTITRTVQLTSGYQAKPAR